MANNALINSIADRLADELVTSSGEHASQAHVADVVAAAAAPLRDAPLQQFVALLVENAARGRLHDEGLHGVSIQ